MFRCPLSSTEHITWHCGSLSSIQLITILTLRLIEPHYTWFVSLIEQAFNSSLYWLCGSLIRIILDLYHHALRLIEQAFKISLCWHCGSLSRIQLCKFLTWQFLSQRHTSNVYHLSVVHQSNHWDIAKPTQNYNMYKGCKRHVKEM